MRIEYQLRAVEACMHIALGKDCDDAIRYLRFESH